MKVRLAKKSLYYGRREVSIPPKLIAPGFNLEEDFGIYVFGDDKMKSRLNAEMYKRYKQARETRSPIPNDVAESVAHAMKEWAMSHGATHFTHWFQPLTGLTAEKHDSFLGIEPKTGKPFSTFKGKLLIGGEADGSSFPSGGLRSTPEARAYTIWDPQTPAFLMMENGVPTLSIPTCLYSWDGSALDRKTPMLRSQMALEDAAHRLFEALGDKTHTHIHTDSGVEQEFFIISRANYEKRPDLLMTKRTLQGAHPAKTQQLADHYYAPMPTAALKFQHRVEVALWKLGIPLTTRHQEVAPNQFEWAPIFSKSSVAADQNQIAMEVMRRLAENYGLEILLHEKPFARINGSGKHNNWSIGNNNIPTFFDPGNDPEKNLIFLISLASFIRGVDLHQDLIRWSVASASNDYRLGGHEAPPAIMSTYLGDFIGELVSSIVEARPMKKLTPQKSIGVDYLPARKPDDSDRNRTSPIAFTGNKFELRAVGSSQSVATSNTILNVIMADSFNQFATDLHALRSKVQTKFTKMNDTSR